MTNTHNDLHQALTEVSASSAGGAAFLIAYGLTLFISAILFFFVPLPTAALIAMFQGSVALPLAFWLERRLGSRRMAPDNPLWPLSVQMAMSQTLALPAAIVAYSLIRCRSCWPRSAGRIFCRMPGCIAPGSTPFSPLQFPLALLSCKSFCGRRRFPTFSCT